MASSKELCRKRYSSLKQGGFCVDCGRNKAETNYIKCGECLQKHRLASSRHQEKRAKTGVCKRCGRPSASGHISCNRCLELARGYAKKRTAKYSEQVGNYFNNKCAICGLESTDTEIFDAHHVDPKIKERDISKKVYSHWDKVIPELQKCVYLCKICHARLHAGRFDSYLKSGKLILIPGEIKEKKIA